MKDQSSLQEGAASRLLGLPLQLGGSASPEQEFFYMVMNMVVTTLEALAYSSLTRGINICAALEELRMR